MFPTMVLKTSLVLVCFIHYCLCTNNAKKEARDPLGVTKFTEKIGKSRIINGTDAANGEFPWQVSLQYKFQGAYHHFCGGSILNKRSILTAAHCIEWLYDNENLEVFVIAGVTDLNMATDNDRYKINNFWIHRRYNSQAMDADVAVIRLQDYITLEKDVAEAVALPRSKRHRIKEGTLVEVTGWGFTEHEFFPDWLQKVELYIVPRRTCKNSYAAHGHVSRNMICAAGFQKDACQGDSGGPLVDKDTKVQHGIVSWGIGCALPEYPGIYTKLSNYAKWVKRRR